MQIQGIITAVLPQRTGTSSKGTQWVCATYVIEIPGVYPRHIAFDVFGADRIQQFNIQQGEQLTVDIDIDARPYNDRWYNSIRAWNVQREAVTTAVPAASTPSVQPQSPQTPTDDLPF